MSSGVTVSGVDDVSTVSTRSEKIEQPDRRTAILPIVTVVRIRERGAKTVDL